MVLSADLVASVSVSYSCFHLPMNLFPEREHESVKTWNLLHMLSSGKNKMKGKGKIFFLITVVNDTAGSLLSTDGHPPLRELQIWLKDNLITISTEEGFMPCSDKCDCEGAEEYF